MASGDESLLNVLRAYRNVFNQENPNMSPAERDHKFRQHWNRISTELNFESVTASMPESLVPQKRSASCDSQFGLESSTKRTAAASPLNSAPPLERHISAPSGYSPIASTRDLVLMDSSVKSVPINIPSQRTYSQRRKSVSMASRSTRSPRVPEPSNTHQFRDMALVDYLAQSPEVAVPLAPTFAFTAPDPGHGEWNMTHTTLFAASSCEGTHSPATATSDSCLTTASTAYSEPMSRCTTNDQICEPFGMFNMDPSLASIPDVSLSDMTGATYSSSLSVSSHVDMSSFPLSSSIPEYQPISFSSSMMKPSLSQESVSSSSSDSISFQFPLSSSIGQAVQVKAPRSIAPKTQNDVSKHPPMPKLVAITGEDGVVKHKAEIARAARQPQQRKTQFCDFCNDQPQGFHGEHELRRHIDRQHTQYRKVWICCDISEDGTFLRNCKACRNRKTYGANYNAAAHLRRTHFNPCKNKRGGRGKKSEGRGGMGGGNYPSMEELKQWMFETYEMNLNGRVIVQHMPTETNVPQVPMTELTQFDHNATMSDEFKTSYDMTGLHEPHDF